MDRRDREEIVALYPKFRNYAENAGEFFRNKSQYSELELLSFITDFYTCYIKMRRNFEEDKEFFEEGKTIELPDENGKKMHVGLNSLDQDYAAAISVIYFNLSTDEIEHLVAACAKNGFLNETLIVKKVFERFKLHSPTKQGTV